MELPASLREINPVIDQMARGEPVHDGAALRLAVALGLATPDRSLTEAGRAYARPALAEGAQSLVMSPERRTAAEGLLGGALPLQASLRRLLRQVTRQGAGLVAPLSLGWPEALLRPYLSYLEDLGLLVAIGPMVEVTARGRAVAALPDPEPVRAPLLLPAEVEPDTVPTFQHARFRYYLVRQVCLHLVALRGRREWHLLQPLLDGPLAALKPAYAEWLARFQGAQPAMRRSWNRDLVSRYEAEHPAPSWFTGWCHSLLGADPSEAAQALADSPGLLRNPTLLTEGLRTREGWLTAVAIHWATNRGRGLRYAEACACFEDDGLAPGPWPDMQTILEEAGLLVSAGPEVRLLLPVEIHAPAEALWPYGGPEWVAAALLEWGALAIPSHARRPVSV